MKRFNVGDKVNFHSIIGKSATSFDHEIWHIKLMHNSFGCDVAWITGKAGCVSLDALSRTETETL